MSISSIKIFFMMIAFFSMTFFTSGCGQNQTQTQKQVNATKVKVIQAIKTDAPMSYEYSGQVISKGEVKVQSKISGRITEKYIRGGQNVSAGQALYKVDSRQYEASVLQAQANLSKSRINLNNEINELERNQRLFDSGAISEKTLTDQQVKVNAQRSEVSAQEALLTRAQEDLADTIVYAPISGKLAIDDVALGTYVNAGNTTLVSIGSFDPIFVQFSISESEYLKFASNSKRNESDNVPQGVRIKLSLADGTVYPYDGYFAEADKAMANNTGTLSLRVLFDNPDNFLVPGMFAKISITGLSIPNAILVPERAIQQLLGESFVLVANEQNKSEIRTVKLGEKLGSYYIITSGIKANDKVIIEGLSKLRENMPIEVTEVTAEEMGFSINKNDTLFNSDK